MSTSESNVVEHGNPAVNGVRTAPVRSASFAKETSEGSESIPVAPRCEQGLLALRRIVALLFSLQLSAVCAATFTENFSTDPAAHDWQVYGDANLFTWDNTNQNLRVTWDSSKTNSYFHRPLGTILASDDDFSLSFDLTFTDYASGVTPGKPYSFPIALGFLNLDQATQTNFCRGAGINATYGPKNLVEFNFFPAFDVFLPTINQVIVATNNTWLYNHDNLLEMAPGETFRVAMNYAAAPRTLTTIISNNAVQYGLTQIIALPPNFDFRVTAVSISSYSDVRDISSSLAHGTVDNFSVTVPAPPVQDLLGAFVGANWQVQFSSRTNWFYTLERTTNFTTWSAAAAATPGNGALLLLSDINPAPDAALYRVRANRP